MTNPPSPARAALEALRRSEIDPPWSCSHDKRELRRRLTGAGERYYRQCLRCGSGELVRKDTIPLDTRAAVATFDEELQTTWSAEVAGALDARRQEFQTHRDEEQAKWWEWYSAYLQTPEWRQRRALVLRRANGRCEGCGVAAATQAHHLTYERVGAEMLFDLVAICDACHERIHEDRS